MRALIVLAALAGPFASGQETKPKTFDDELKCGGIWYDSASCACKKADGPCCPCEKCTGCADCPCLDILKKDAGTIRGTLKNPWFKRIEGVVFVREVKERKFALPRTNPVMDQKSLVFTPHVMAVLAGSTVDFPNGDSVRHNVYSTKDSCCNFNLGTYPSGETKQVKFEKPGVVKLLCNVHAEMSAFIVVCQNPYFARIDKANGTFEIRSVPAGTYKLAVFHEKTEAEDVEVKVEAGKVAEVEFTKFQKK